MAEIRHLKIDMTSFFSAEGGPIWIKFRRLVQKSKTDVEFQYGGSLGEFSSMLSQSHVSHCRVLSLGEFTVMIPEPHAILQCHYRATLQGVRIPSAILKIVFRHILFFCFCLKCGLGLDKRRLSYCLQYTCLYQSRFATKRPRSVSCLSVVSFNSTIPRAQSFIISYFGFRFTNAYYTINSSLLCLK